MTKEAMVLCSVLPDFLARGVEVFQVEGADAAPAPPLGLLLPASLIRSRSGASSSQPAIHPSSWCAFLLPSLLPRFLRGGPGCSPSSSSSSLSPSSSSRPRQRCPPRPPTPPPTPGRPSRSLLPLETGATPDPEPCSARSRLCCGTCPPSRPPWSGPVPPAPPSSPASSSASSGLAGRRRKPANMTSSRPRRNGWKWLPSTKMMTRMKIPQYLISNTGEALAPSHQEP